MNNFNAVFTAIKTEAAKQKGFAELNCFETIAKMANVSLHKLPTYLEHLQYLGLIRYSLDEKYIHLTATGNKLEKICKE